MGNERKVAVVTAGGSGMGAGAARRLAADGFAVAILSSSGKGESLAGELGGIGVTGSNQSCDDLKRLIDRTLDQWGRIDVLVNSARARTKGAGSGTHGRRLAHRDGGLLTECRPPDAAGDSRDAAPAEWSHRQHFDVRGIRA